MDPFTHNTEASDETPLSRRERLICRLVDGESSVAEWAEFCALADAEPDGRTVGSAWRELAEAQRDHAMLAGAFSHATAGVEHAELPIPRERFVGIGFGSPRSAPARNAVTWGGWLAVAAAVTFAWFNGLFVRPETSVPPGGHQAALVGDNWFRINSPEDALRAYKERGQQTGQVLGEMPQFVLIDSQPSLSGTGYQVVYVRQIVERAEVSDLYTITRDDAGQAVPIPAEIFSPASTAY